MRCKNCGFTNPSERMRCEKCNAPLSGSMIEYGQNENKIQPNDGLAGTIKGKHIATDPWDCPDCGRPVIPSSTECNQCGYNFSTGKTPSAKEPVQITPVEQPKSDDNYQEINIRKKGIDPKKTISPDTGFILKPIVSKFDKVELQEVKVRPMGDEVMVGREILEEDNATISREQAMFINIKGKWHIKNVSENKTTYILASEFIELQDGDIIKLGNREFIFST
jgi:hypothetical protein